MAWKGWTWRTSTPSDPASGTGRTLPSATMETIEVERSDGLVTVTLNRPSALNAASPTMWKELTATFEEIADNRGDRVLVITGAGDAFCSGADLSGVSHTPPHVTMRVVNRCASALLRLSTPTIARVNGVAAGAGANLALACDLVVASSTARFCEIFSRRGLSVDFGGSWLLPRLVGLHKAKELVLLADMLTADEAAVAGLVNKVVPPEQLDAVVAEWAQRLVAGPPRALALSKALLDHGLQRSVDEALDAEADAQVRNLASEDVAEAMAAWREKRTPTFTGR